jgi:hypothetical protein
VDEPAAEEEDREDAPASERSSDGMYSQTPQRTARLLIRFSGPRWEEEIVSEDAETVSEPTFEERRFRFLEKVCGDLFPGVEGVEFEWEDLEGESIGSNNDVGFVNISIDGKPVEKLVLRMPKPKKLLDDRDQVIQEMFCGIGITELLESHGIQAPTIIGYSIRDDNLLGRPYQLMKRLPGKALSDCYSELSWKALECLVRDHVDFLVKMDKIVFDSFGTVKVQAGDAFAGPGTSNPVMPEFPVSVPNQLSVREPKEVIPLLIRRIERQIEKDSSRRGMQDLNVRRKRAVEQLEQLGDMDVYKGLSLEHCRLYAWDMQRRNVLVDPKTGHITGFVDWDDPESFPQTFHRNTRMCDFLWTHDTHLPCGESLIGPLYPGYGKKAKSMNTKAVKVRRYFREQVEKAIPGYWNDLGKMNKGAMILFGLASDRRRVWENYELDDIERIYGCYGPEFPVVEEEPAEELVEQEPQTPTPPTSRKPSSSPKPSPKPQTPVLPPTPPQQPCGPGQTNCPCCGGAFKRGRGLQTHMNHWKKNPSSTRRHCV